MEKHILEIHLCPLWGLFWQFLEWSISQIFPCIQPPLYKWKLSLTQHDVRFSFSSDELTRQISDFQICARQQFSLLWHTFSHREKHAARSHSCTNIWENTGPLCVCVCVCVCVSHWQSSRLLRIQTSMTSDELWLHLSACNEWLEESPPG